VSRAPPAAALVAAALDEGGRMRLMLSDGTEIVADELEPVIRRLLGEVDRGREHEIALDPAKFHLPPPTVQ
jgi:hypothetical protein